MIDENILLDELEETFSYEFLHEKKFCFGKYSFMDLLEEMIDELTKVDCGNCSRRKFYQKGYQEGLNASKWIPCSERLPENCGRYLVCSEDVIWVADFFNNIWWGIERRCRWGDVQAWMPLPKPYRGEEK